METIQYMNQCVWAYFFINLDVPVPRLCFSYKYSTCCLIYSDLREAKEVVSWCERERALPKKMMNMQLLDFEAQVSLCYMCSIKQTQKILIASFRPRHHQFWPDEWLTYYNNTFILWKFEDTATPWKYTFQTHPWIGEILSLHSWWSNTVYSTISYHQW